MPSILSNSWILYNKFPHIFAIVLLFTERLILLELLLLLLPLLLEMPITGVLSYLARCPRLSCKLQWVYSDRQNIRGHFRLSIGYLLLYRASQLCRKPYFHILFNHMILYGMFINSRIWLYLLLIIRENLLISISNTGRT